MGLGFLSPRRSKSAEKLAGPVILVTLREWNSYGYELMERAAAFGFEAMNPGTLYRTLRHMEKEGLCVSKWGTSKGNRPEGCIRLPKLGSQEETNDHRVGTRPLILGARAAEPSSSLGTLRREAQRLVRLG